MKHSNKDHYNFLKSMIFYDDGDHWDFVSQSDDFYYDSYNERISKDMLDIFKQIPNILNRNKKYKNLETIEEIDNAIDEIYDKLSGKQGIKIAKVF